MLTARLHPIKPKKGGEVYSVIFRGKLLVERSKEPEFDAARALLAKGITGKLTLLDGKTGKPRIVIDLEQLAHLTVEEGPNGPRFVKYRQTVVDRSPTAETDEGEGLNEPHVEATGGHQFEGRGSCFYSTARAAVACFTSPGLTSDHGEGGLNLYSFCQRIGGAVPLP